MHQQVDCEGKFGQEQKEYNWLKHCRGQVRLIDGEAVDPQQPLPMTLFLICNDLLYYRHDHHREVCCTAKWIWSCTWPMPTPSVGPETPSKKSLPLAWDGGRNTVVLLMVPLIPAHLLTHSTTGLPNKASDWCMNCWTLSLCVIPPSVPCSIYIF